MTTTETYAGFTITRKPVGRGLANVYVDRLDGQVSTRAAFGTVESARDYCDYFNARHAR